MSFAAMRGLLSWVHTMPRPFPEMSLFLTRGDEPRKQTSPSSFPESSLLSTTGEENCSQRRPTLFPASLLPRISCPLPLDVATSPALFPRKTFPVTGGTVPRKARPVSQPDTVLPFTTGAVSYAARMPYLPHDSMVFSLTTGEEP